MNVDNVKVIKNWIELEYIERIKLIEKWDINNNSYVSYEYYELFKDIAEGGGNDKDLRNFIIDFKEDLESQGLLTDFNIFIKEELKYL